MQLLKVRFCVVMPPMVEWNALTVLPKLPLNRQLVNADSIC